MSEHLTRFIFDGYKWILIENWTKKEEAKIIMPPERKKQISDK